MAELGAGGDDVENRGSRGLREERQEKSQYQNRGKEGKEEREKLTESGPLILCSLAPDTTPSVKSPIASQGPPSAPKSTRPSLIFVHHI